MHLVENMGFYGDTPWHGLGHHFTEPVTDVDYARIQCGLNSTVWARALTCPGTGGTLEVPDHYAIVRHSFWHGSVFHPETVLGVVGNKYTIFQNEQAFDLLRPFIEGEMATFSAAGSLMGGKRIWILCELSQEWVEVAPGDPIAKYLLYSHAHDGTLSHHFGFTPIRVVCANTEAMAREHQGSALIKVRHTKGAELTLEVARDAILAANTAFDKQLEEYRFLAHKQVNMGDLCRFFGMLSIRQKDNSEQYKKLAAGDSFFSLDEELSKITQNKVDTLLNLFEGGRGSHISSIRGTWWAAYNAYTEYINWEHGRTQESRLQSVWMGTSNTDNQDALELATAFAEAA